MVTGLLMFLPILAALAVAMRTRSGLAFVASDGVAIAAVGALALVQAATCRHMALDHLVFTPLVFAAVAVAVRGAGALGGAIGGAWAGLAFVCVSALAFPPSAQGLERLAASGTIPILGGAVVPIALATCGGLAGAQRRLEFAALAPLAWFALPMTLHPDLLRVATSWAIPAFGCAAAALVLATRNAQVAGSGAP